MRLAALDSYRILDTVREQAFDDIVTMAAEMCGTPMALISLVDDRREWFKASVGVDLPEMPREGGFSAHTITRQGVLLIEDIAADPQFANHPMVTSNPHLRFYAGTPLLTPDGLAMGSLCVMDSTPRRLSAEQYHALQALGRQVMTQLELRKSLADKSESAEQFQSFAQIFPNHVWTSPPDGLLDWFNDRIYEYSGLAYSDLHGTGWTQMVHQEDRVAAGENWAAAIVPGGLYEAEFRLRRADGVYRWHLARALPLRGNDGRVLRWVGTNTDIHERKLSEVEMTRDHDRMWSVSQELMLICDFTGLITAVNPATIQHLGFSQEELVGTNLNELLHPEDRASTAAEMLKLASGASTLAFENRYRTKDGGHCLLDWTAVPYAGLVHSVARDITKERATDDALHQSRKMEAIGQLSGGIAHDFNNLLQGITVSLDLVKKRVGQGRLEDLDRYLGGAMGSVHRAAALTQRLLAFSRRQPLDARPIEPNKLIDSMEDLVRRTIGEHIKFESLMDEGLWLTRCDSNQLENAILNLVINARDAMPSGGVLTVEAGNAHLDSVYASMEPDIKAGQYVCIGVTDTGVGMSADTISKAFEPFYTTKPIGQGTGLGLSMIYGFAKQSEGLAKIYSEVGKGTTVKLYLPRYLGDAVAESPTLAAAVELQTVASESILVVEDEEVVRALIVEVMRELGYRVLEAKDGPTGLAILQRNQSIDLLIADVGLPGFNGRQLAEAARQVRPELKVLFMTGYAENAAVTSGFLEHDMAMITKPFAVETLAAMIRQMLET